MSTTKHAPITFQPIPRNGRKVLGDDNGPKLMLITFHATMIQGASLYPSIQRVKSFTEARKTWKEWTGMGYNCELI